MKLHTSRVCCTAALALGLAFGVACVKIANDNQVASDIQSKISADSSCVPSTANPPASKTFPFRSNAAE